MMPMTASSPMNQAHDRAKDILERDVDLLHRLSDVLVEREAIDGKELLRFVEGKQPIPTKEELLLETKTRREEEQAAQPSSGPDLIRSASSERASELAEQIPARPDWA